MNNRRLYRIFYSILILIFSTSGFNSWANWSSDTTRFEILQKASSEEISYNYPAALDKGIEALVLAKELGTIEELARAHKQLGLLYWVDGYYYKSIEHLDESYSGFKSLGDLSEAASARHTKALNYYYMAMNDSAIFYHTEALNLFNQVDDHKMEAKILSHIALVYHKMGNYTETINFILESNKIRNLYDDLLSAYNLNSSNPAFRDSSYYETELIRYKEDLTKVIAESDSLEIANVKHNIGLSYYLLEDYDKALIAFNESNLVYSALGFLPYWNESVKALRELERYEEASELLKKQEKVIAERGTRITLSEIYGLQGDISFKTGDYQSALSYYERFYSLSEAMNNRFTITNSYRKLSNTYAALNNYQKALEVAKKGLELAKTISAIEAQRLAYANLSEIYAQTGEYEQAYLYEQEEKKLINQINEGEASINIVKAQAEYDAIQKSEEINRLNLEGIIQESKVDNLRITIIAVLIFGVAVFGLAIILYYQYLLKSRSNKLLAKKNVEIATKSDELKKQYKEKDLLLGETHHRVKNNLQVINSLLSVQALKLKDENAKSAVLESQNRVQVMGLIHENLYQKNNFGAIDMEDYLKQLANNLSVSYGHNENLDFIVRTNKILLDEDTAIYLGLITNELLTNSLKYAFKEVAKPEIELILREHESELRLEIKDNGCGMEDIDIDKSYGLSLVQALVKQLNGNIEFNCNEGTKTCLSLKKYKIAT